MTRFRDLGPQAFPPDSADADEARAKRGGHRWVCSGPEDDQPWCGDCGYGMELHQEEPRFCPGPHGREEEA